MRMSLLKLSLYAPVLLISGCVGDVAHRTNLTPIACGQIRDCGYHAVEHHQYQAEDGLHGYRLGYVEFDDQGEIQNEDQQKAVLKALVENARGPGEHQIVVVYVHGWKHSAAPGDNDIVEFQKLLKNMDILERAAAPKRANNRIPRKVFGIYVGWRGASVTVPLLKEATFWTRKNAAERVGQHSAKELFLKLDAFRKIANQNRHDNELSPDKTQLIIIGHSFGGLITYHALNTLLLERALHVVQRPVQEATARAGRRTKPTTASPAAEQSAMAEATAKLSYRYDIAKSFGDFVLLVNPAFEGVAYEPLFSAAKNRCYSPRQKPVMAIVTSRGDWATNYAFPAGRFYTWAQSAPHHDRDERAAVLNTVGHLPRYQTHSLEPAPSSAVTAAATQGKDIDRSQASIIIDEAVAKRSIEEQAAAQPAATVPPAVPMPLGDAMLVPNGKANLPAHFPYYVVSAHEEIIRDHGDIWNERFFKVMRDFFVKQIIAPQPKAVKDTSPCLPFDMTSGTPPKL